MLAQAAGDVEIDISRADVERLASEHGDAFYLLDLDRVTAAHAALLEPFRRRHPATVVAYSVKTNYMPRLLQRMRELGSLAEVVSEMEYQIALKAGFEPGQILVNGAVHREEFLERLLLQGVRLNLDGWYMLEKLHDVSRAHPHQIFHVGLRLSYPVPDAEVSRFGFETSEPGMRRLADWFRVHENCELIGFHSHFCFAPNRVDAYRARIAGLVDAAAWFPQARLSYLDLGSGFRHGGDGPSFAEIADAVTGVLEDRFSAAERPTLVIEPGTAIVGHSMAFVCRVYDVKTVAGQALALVNGSSHSINTMGWRTRIPVEVVRTRNAPWGDGDGAPEFFDVVGNTAMERKDHICAGIPGPVSPGDYLVFDKVGSYSCTMKPPFIHPCPAVIAREQGRYEVVKRRETVDDFLRTYLF